MLEFKGNKDPDSTTKRNLRFLERPCRCDEECHRYGDCCYDAPAADVGTSISNNNISKGVEFSRNSLACLPLRFKDNDHTPDQKVTLHKHLLTGYHASWLEMYTTSATSCLAQPVFQQCFPPPSSFIYFNFNFETSCILSSDVIFLLLTFFLNLIVSNLTVIFCNFIVFCIKVLHLHGR